MRWGLFLMLIPLAAAPAAAQTPQPFPRPAGSQSPPARTPETLPPRPPDQQADSAAAPGAPTAATLGVPIYPGAHFLASYDAGRGQRYYLFGTAAPFADVVSYYRTQLDERGALVFRDPPTHMFDVGRFREESMAFPPGVTVKDWTSGGSRGYPNPAPGAQPERFATIIMVVPPPPVPPPRSR